MSKSAIIAGATGLIGKQLLLLLLQDQHYDKVISISRRPTGINHDKLIEVITSFDQLSSHRSKLKGDDVFICLGSTMKKAGSKELFELYDYTYPLELAKLCLENSASQVSIVTAMGANSSSNLFYIRVKGNLEIAIRDLKYNCINIFRPSLLIGEREDERTFEAVAQQFYKSLGWMFAGPIKKYKAIDGQKVASAMHRIAADDLTGFNIFESNEIEAKG